MKNFVIAIGIIVATVFIIFFSSCGGGSDSDAPAKQWTEANNAPFAFTRFDAEYSNETGKVYFLGGRTSTGTTDGSIWEFNPATGAYADTGEDMTYPVANYNIARLNDGGGNEVLVIFGGILGTGVTTNIVQGFYPASNTTVVFTSDSYPIVTNPGGVTVVNNIAYVFGGFDSTNGVRSDCNLFDITAAIGARWTAGPALSKARGYIATAVVDGVIYAIGGDDWVTSLLTPLSVTEKLDTTAGTLAWDDVGVADLPVTWDQARAFGFDTSSDYHLAGSIVVAGCGRHPSEYTDSLRYDVASNTWDVSFPDLNQARRNHAGTFIPAGTGTGRPGMWVWGGRQGLDANVLSIPEYY